MKQKAAEQEATRLTALKGITAYVVRILPADVDPIIFGDNGWDVEVTIDQEEPK